jgi:HEAT repeat protein
MLRPTFFTAGFVFTLLAHSSVAAEPTLSQLDYSGSPQAVEALDRELYAAGTDPVKLAVIEQRLLASLRARDTTYAARQVLCQRLGWVLGLAPEKLTAAGLKPLPAMLVDERDSDLARLALEPAPGAVIDTLFLTALNQTTARTRIALIDSIARRQIVAAVPTLATLLSNNDPATAAAAARALGFITDHSAAVVLLAVPEPSPAAVAAAKLALAPRLAAGSALAVLADLRARAVDPVHRIAALRLLLQLDPSIATTLDVLDGNDTAAKHVVLESIYASRAPQIIPALAAKLSTWDALTQTAVIAAMARRGDAAAISALLKATAHEDAKVRTAALEALGFLPGTIETMTALTKVAAGTATAENKIAKASLARLNGPALNAAILTGAERGETAWRVVLIEQIALRGLSEGLPLLVKLRADPDSAIRAAAVTALGELAPPADNKIVLDWAIAATDANEQARALRALVSITLRNPDVAGRGAPLYAALETAPAELALRLLPALGRIGGAPSAACAAKLALNVDFKLAEAALAALVRWPDDTAVAALVSVAERTTLPALRASAVSGVIAAFERNRAFWNADATALVARLLVVSAAAESRLALITLLKRAVDAPALALAEKSQSDPVIGAAAGETAAVIRANQAGPAKLRASTMAGVKNLTDGNTGNRWSVPAEGDEWVEVDFILSRPLRRITLDQTGRGAEFPESYELYVTDDVAVPGKVVATGVGQTNKTVIDLPVGTRGRYVIIKNVAARKDTPWSICEIFVD